MLGALSVVQFIVWVLGVVWSRTMRGFLHVFPVVAVGLVVLSVTQPDVGSVALVAQDEQRNQVHAWAGAIAISGLLLRARRK
jgi:hypothetical protein